MTSTGGWAMRAAQVSLVFQRTDVNICLKLPLSLSRIFGDSSGRLLRLAHHNQHRSLAG